MSFILHQFQIILLHILLDDFVLLYNFMRQFDVDSDLE